MLEAREVKFPGEKEDGERGVVACWTVHLVPCSFQSARVVGDVALLEYGDIG